MKRTAILATTLLASALMMAALAGCGSQAPSGDSSTSESVSAPVTESSPAVGQPQDEIVAELKDAIANEPAYKSVTLTETTKATFKIEADAAEGAESEEPSSSDTIETTTVCKFDASGENLKTDTTSEFGDFVIRYCSDGDDAVCVTEGPVYSGTTEQFDEAHFAGIEAYLEGTIGNLDTIIDCIGTVEKEQQGDLTVYMLTLDPEKYMASDEILTFMKESGDPVVSAVFELGFDNEGHLASIHEVIEYYASATDCTYTLSGFDSTVIDPMPAADKTYEEMEADINEKLESLEDELDATSEYQDEAASSDTAAAE